jgi:hypothetical protein
VSAEPVRVRHCSAGDTDVSREGAYARRRNRAVEISHRRRPPRPPRLSVGAAPASPPRAVLAEDEPPAGLRSAAAVALAASGLVLGPALWLGLAAWAWSGGLALAAVPLGALGLSAALVAGLLAARRTPTRAGVGEDWGRRTPLACA